MGVRVCRSDLRCLCALRRRSNTGPGEDQGGRGRGFDSCQRLPGARLRQTVYVGVRG